MKTPSRYLRSKFASTFSNGLALWTSEDGSMLGIAISETHGWEERLKREWEHIFKAEPFDLSQIKRRFAHQEWAGSDYFDGPGNSQKRGKVWRLTDQPTAFPVLQYELKIPR